MCFGALVALSVIAAPRPGAADITFGDSFDFLDLEEIERVYEKLDPVIVSVKPESTSKWACRDIQLEDHCGDLDGCTVKLLLQHTVNGADQVRGVDEHLFMENPATSSNKKGTVAGYTRQSAGGEHLWESGPGAPRRTVFAPWGWAQLLNYRSAHCPGQTGNSAPHSDPYQFTLMSHPHVHTVAIVKD